MLRKTSEIKIPVSAVADTWLCIYGNTSDTLNEDDPELATERGESPWQLLEGCFYNYYFEQAGKPCNDFQLKENVVVKNSLRKGVAEGRISPNIYVGSLALEVYEKANRKSVETIYLEVLPTKLDASHERKEDIDYRTNYEFMLAEIAEKSTELLLQVESPVYQNFEVDFNKDPQTIYQRFAFIKSLLHNDEFFESVQQVISSPTSRWTTESEMTDVVKIRKLNSKIIRQLSGGSNRIKLNRKLGVLESVSQRIESSRKVETYDTHENRFIKYALQTFLQFVRDCENVFAKSKYEKSRSEASAMAVLLENQLHHSFFDDISRPAVLKLNSPALQRKSGYREILSAWLKFDLSLRLVWRGGDDVYKAGKRDIAVLYEYWLFFKLYDLIVEKFQLKEIKHEDNETKEIKKYDHLIDVTNDGMQLIVKSGTYTALECYYSKDGWEYNIRFSYNKTFSGNTPYKSGKEGSWSKPLRPDYTLSIWPKKLSDIKAEAEEQIVHIHFDSKYKVQQFLVPETVETEINDVDDLSDEPGKIDSLAAEKRNELKGIYKNADLMKMHAYKDAIRRTGGAYIIYPGTELQMPLRGFHEIIPGLGAFAVRPQKSDNGMEALSDFIDTVISNFRNAASQQKKYAVKTYETFKDESNTVNDPMPHGIIPDETFVLVGYCRNIANINGFYNKHGLYNFRMDDEKGALELNEKLAKAKYLLLRTPKNKEAHLIYKIMGNGPKVYSGKHLEEMGYKSEKLKDYYLVFSIAKETTNELGEYKYRFEELEEYKNIQEKNPREKAGIPFLATITELMYCK